jgi:hypothetical protein
MNQAALGKIVIIILALVFAVVVMLDVLTSYGSSLGRLYLYVAIFSFIFACVAPRGAFALFIFCTCYIDLFKRFMIVYGRPSQLDLYYVLGIPPLLIAGIVAHLLLSFIIGQRPIERKHIVSFMLSFFFLGISLFASMNDYSGGRAFGNAINQGAYSFLFFIIPTMLTNFEEILKLFRWMVWLFVGVAIYMLKQHFFGLSDFEFDYLRSNLSMESRILYENDGALRGFSTMSGAQTVAVFCTCMIVILIAPIKKVGEKFVKIALPLRLILIPLFLYAAWATVSRGGWVCGITALVVYAILWKKPIAIFGYVTMGVMVLTLIFSSSYILENNVLQDIQLWLQDVAGSTGNAYADRALVMGTMTARFEGFVNLTSNPKIWTPFGMGIAGDKDYLTGGTIMYAHDFITEFLIKYGYIAFVITGIISFWMFTKMNKIYFSMPKGSIYQIICRVSLAFALGIMSGGLGNGAQLWVFPQNFYFYFFLAVVYTVGMERLKIKNVQSNSQIMNDTAVRLSHS